ncbi:hypothetical protein D3248_10660 [Leucobacter zeae]|nr:hypothetical protein [Leucobacter zeae]
MRRPRWIAALLLALLVAAAFAWLGQWQMGNAVRTQSVAELDTETPRPLADVAELSQGVTEDGAGVVVELDGSFVPGDTRVVAPRVNEGETGAWVVGHLATSGPDAAEGAHLAVAIGWAPSASAAEAAAERLEADPAFAEPLRLEGRYMPAEAPKIPDADADPQSMQAMVPAHLANLWTGVDGSVYAGYLVLHADADGGAADTGPMAAASLLGAADLDAIDSVAPLPVEAVNWLNVFYAVEWIVFAGFAIFLWYRLARDSWEKEHEMQLLEAGEGADPEIDRTRPE